MFQVIKVGVKEVNVFSTSPLPCVTLHISMVGSLEGAWCSNPKDGTLNVFSVVLVCSCNLTLCLKEVIFLSFHWEPQYECSSSGHCLTSQ